MDLGFKGSKYTWTNKRYTRRQDLILQMLDMCFAIDDWIEIYPESTITHLPRTHSDYFPLLLNLINHYQTFRFESIWCNHLEFSSIMQDNFPPTDDLLRATSVFKIRVANWNKHVFGNIFHRKRHILARLTSIQNSDAYPFSRFLQELEANL